MNKQLIAAIIIVVVVAAGGVFLLKNSKNKTATSNTNVNSSALNSANVHQIVSKITVVATEFSFSPNVILAESNKPIAITFKNDGKYPHNLTVANVGATKTIQPGMSDTVTLTPKKKGTYPFTCTVDSHAEKGMSGMLIVK
jgi:plastocyanin